MIDQLLEALGRRRSEVGGTPLGVYLHVPYCARRCGYCAFNTYVVDDPDERGAAHRRFVDGAVAELTTAARVLGEDVPPLTSVYVGGGTPSLLAPEMVTELLDAVRSRFPTGPDLEVTVEANPDSVDPRGLDGWRSAGATRVSLGVQSGVGRVLDLLDRTHGPDTARLAVEAARAAGFAHVGVDLIYGTPGESAGDWDRTLDLALSLGTDHLSAYALGIERGTRLAARVRAGSLPQPSDDEAADRYRRADERFGAAGFEWYEISNWATSDDAQCRHNRLYWDNHHWWGVGPGAHSHVAGVRWANEPDPTRWAGAAADGAPPAAECEVLDDGARSLERVLLGIRTSRGLAIDDLASAQVRQVVDDGLAEVRDGRLVLTVDGRLLADTVVRVLVA